MSKTIRTFGTWPSRITAKTISQGLRLSDVQWDSDGATLVWLEGRGDRGVLVASQLDGDAPRDVTDDLSVRARLGYGGGDFAAAQGKTYFCSSGRIYAQALSGGATHALTPALGQAASPVVSPDGRWLLYVYSHERQDGLALVDTAGKLWPQKAASGHDFYMQPRFSPDGRHAAWVAWDHPQMPWDGSRLFVADVAPQPERAPLFTNLREIAGGAEIAVFQPEFSPDGKYLAFMSDETGWHNLHTLDLDTEKVRVVTRETNAQLGQPAWVQGQRAYGWLSDSSGFLCVRNERGFSRLWRYDLKTGKGAPVPGLDEYTDIVLPAFHPKKDMLAAMVSGGTRSLRLVTLDLAAPKKTPAVRVLKRATSENIAPEELSAPQALTWKTGRKQESHGLYYSPASGRYTGEGRPPAIIRIHGGPTSQSRAAYNGDIQFFATRGFAVLDVNYRGSTGYGRAYMNALRGHWGISDVEDAVSGARHLVDSRRADPEKLVIMGGSAGGYTVLQALVRHPRFFRAGVCLYGVSDMFSLAAETHKFEERYLDSLLGPLPQARELYRDRSPLYHADNIVDPLAVFQGDEDEVVPRAQSDVIVESLRRRGVPHEYHVFAGEGHGWRKPETIEKFYTAVLKFLQRHVIYS